MSARTAIAKAHAIAARLHERPAAIEDLIEATGDAFGQLVRAIDPTAHRDVERHDARLRRALPHGRRDTLLLAYQDAESVLAIAHMKAGYLVGLAVAQEMYRHTLAPPRTKGGRR